MKTSFKKSTVMFAVAAIMVTMLSGICLAKEKEVTSGTIKLKNQKESAFPDLAKITIVHAMKSAQARVKGKVLKAELENENNYLVYGIEIVTADKSISDVKVDAGSGKVLLVEKDTEDSKKSRSDDDDEGEDDSETRD